MLRVSALPLAVLVLSAAAGAWGDDDVPWAGRSVAMRRTPEPPIVDGVLDEAIWADAPVATDLRQFEPVEGEPASERTEIRLLYDSNFVYLGVRCYDREPGEIIAKVLKRDSSLQSDDRITFNFDTFHDQLNGYMFSINPLGARWDALINNLDVDQEWNGIWYGRSRIDDEGWSAEIAIPMKTINFDPDGSTWGFNLMRAIRRRNEIVRWTAWSQNLRFGDLGEIGTLEGLEGLEQGLGLDLKPKIASKTLNDNSRDDAGNRKGRSNWTVEPSGDVFYKLTPGLTGVLTLNTDFSETEADERQVNLTQFSLFFPEKREFFLQDQGIFKFAEIEQNAQAFDSRRIGLGVDGEIIDIRGGAKVTGRHGPWNIGALEVRTRHEGDLEAKWLGVARIDYNFFEESRVGVIGTYGDPARNADNSLGGVDLNLRTSSFQGDQVVEASIWGQWSSSWDVEDDGDPATDELDDNGKAWGFKLAYPNDRINTDLELKVLDEEFNPALGFVNRRDIRDWNSNLRYRWRPNSYLRTVDTGGEARWVTDGGGALDTYRYDWEYLELANQAGDMLRFAQIWRRERIEDDFEITDDITIEPDTYHWSTGGATLETAVSRPVSTELSYFAGRFYTGQRYFSRALVEWRPSPHFLISGEWEQNDVRSLCCVIDAGTGLVTNEQDSFTTRIVRFRFNWSWNPDVSWSNFAQYDNISDTLALNSRLQWIIEPGNAFYIVVNPQYDVDESELHSTITETIVKLGWTFRY